MKSQSVTQLDAFGPAAPKQAVVSDAIIQAQPSFLAAILLAMTVSGREDKQIYSPLEIDHAQWSRIRGGTANFPVNRLDQFMDLVGNDIPLRWLAFKRGFELKPLRSELERRVLELEAQLEREREARSTIVRFVKETQR